MLRHADMAMFAAKRSHAGVAAFDPSHDVARQEHLTLLGELRHAIDDGQLRAHYQPKIDLVKGCTSGVEVLLRWQHPDRGLVSPARFMPYAEQTGFVRSVTRWILEESVRQCGEWLRAGIRLPVAVNLSARDLHDPALPARIAALRASHRVPAGLLSLEITESSVMEDPDQALRTLHALRALGVGLAIDDFGTGFSSLAYLKRLPVTELKIDRAFVAGMLDDADDRTIVRSTVELAHNLGLRVVAEGVEDTATLQALKAIGCDLAQGWFASPALDAASLLRWLSTSDWGLPPRADASGPVDHDDAAGNQHERRDQLQAHRFAEQDGAEEHAEQRRQEGERVQCARSVA